MITLIVIVVVVVVDRRNEPVSLHVHRLQFTTSTSTSTSTSTCSCNVVCHHHIECSRRRGRHGFVCFKSSCSSRLRKSREDEKKKWRHNSAQALFASNFQTLRDSVREKEEQLLHMARQQKKNHQLSHGEARIWNGTRIWCLAFSKEPRNRTPVSRVTGGDTNHYTM